MCSNVATFVYCPCGLFRGFDWLLAGGRGTGYKGRSNDGAVPDRGRPGDQRGEGRAVRRGRPAGGAGGAPGAVAAAGARDRGAGRRRVHGGRGSFRARGGKQVGGRGGAGCRRRVRRSDGRRHGGGPPLPGAHALVPVGPGWTLPAAPAATRRARGRPSDRAVRRPADHGAAHAVVAAGVAGSVPPHRQGGDAGRLRCRPHDRAAGRTGVHRPLIPCLGGAGRHGAPLLVARAGRSHRPRRRRPGPAAAHRAGDRGGGVPVARGGGGLRSGARGAGGGRRRRPGGLSSAPAWSTRGSSSTWPAPSRYSGSARGATSPTWTRACSSRSPVRSAPAPGTR